jgi:hypothetical protein
VLLRVPDTAGRYHLLQFVDAWTNNFAYVGRRATGTAAGSFLLVPPGWPGEAPSGTEVIEFPTTVATIVGRWACDGPVDLPAVQALQGKLTLEPSGTAGPSGGIPAPATVPDELAFFEQLRAWMQAFPPSAEDQEYQQRFAPLGLLDPASRYPDCPAELAQALTAGASAGKQKMEAALTSGGLAPVVNGWTLTVHSSTTTSTIWGRAPSMTPPGSCPTGTPATWPGRWPRAAACGATTGTRRPTR